MSNTTSITRAIIIIISVFKKISQKIVLVLATFMLVTLASIKTYSEVF